MAQGSWSLSELEAALTGGRVRTRDAEGRRPPRPEDHTDLSVQQMDRLEWWPASGSLWQVPLPGGVVGLDRSVTLRPDGLPPADEQLGSSGGGSWGAGGDVYKVKTPEL